MHDVDDVESGRSLKPWDHPSEHVDRFDSSEIVVLDRRAVRHRIGCLCQSLSHPRLDGVGV